MPFNTKLDNEASATAKKGIYSLLFAILSVQALWWFVVNPAFHTRPLTDYVLIDKAQVSPISTPTLQAVESANWTDVDLTWSECCKSSYYAARIALPPLSVDGQDAGIIANSGSDNYRLFVNGVSVSSEGRLQPSSYHGLRRGIIRVPHELFKAEGNEALLITARNSLYYTDVFRIVFGDYQSLMEQTKWRRFVMGPLRLINTVIPILISIIAFILLIQAKNRAFIFWLGALSLVWGLRNGFFIWESFPFNDVAHRSYYALLTNAMPVAWFGFIHSWANSIKPSKPGDYALLVLVPIWAILSAIITFTIAKHGVAGVETGERIIEIFGVSVTLLAVIRFAAHLKNWQETRQWEAALFLLCMTTFTIEMAEYFFGQFGNTSSAHAASLFLLAFIVAIIARNVQLFESMEAFNLSLNQKLQASEAKIRQNYLDLEAANREAVLANERQRILQDMHDGIGGQLVGLLAVVRGKPDKNPEIEQALTEALEDLRLIIDSLDNVTDDLAVALGVFRSRVEPRLEAAGYTSQWQFDDLPMELYCPPSHVLQLYRILQESISNALKHSGGDNLRFSAQAEILDGHNKIDLSVFDNGQWKQNDTQGHGMRSMQNRAREMGGTLTVDSTAEGTGVQLSFIIQNDTNTH